MLAFRRYPIVSTITWLEVLADTIETSSVFVHDPKWRIHFSVKKEKGFSEISLKEARNIILFAIILKVSGLSSFSMCFFSVIVIIHRFWLFQICKDHFGPNVTYTFQSFYIALWALLLRIYCYQTSTMCLEVAFQ